MAKITIKRLIDWQLVLEVARVTAGKTPLDKEPSSEWKRKMILAEHSPLRCLMFEITMEDLPYYVSVHYVRHKHGVEHFVRSQRTDRTGVNRDELPQNTPVTHVMVLNAQTILNISRKRLCGMASKETRDVWKAVVAELRNIGETDLADFCVPECVHQGGRCPELKGCGLSRPINPGAPLL